MRLTETRLNVTVSRIVDRHPNLRVPGADPGDRLSRHFSMWTKPEAVAECAKSPRQLMVCCLLLVGCCP
jgi:hypothetical protein